MLIGRFCRSMVHSVFCAAAVGLKHVVQNLSESASEGTVTADEENGWVHSNHVNSYRMGQYCKYDLSLAPSEVPLYSYRMGQYCKYDLSLAPSEVPLYISGVSWNFLEPLPYQYSGILAVGGFTHLLQQYESDIHIYVPVSNSWVKIGDFPVPVSNSRAITQCHYHCKSCFNLYNI